MFANGLDVLGARIALRLRQMVLGILGIVLDHHLVTRDLGHNGCRSDTGDLGVALDHVELVGNGTQRVAVHKHAIRLKARIGNSARDGGTNGTRHAHIIDGLRRNMAKTDGSRHLGDFYG